MDEAEGIGGGDSVEQFHRNEAISAVADEGFGEDDDDYEDLYNDVNVGEGFLQSLRKNEDVVGFKDDESRVESQDRVQVRDAALPAAVENSESLIPGVGRGEGERKFEGDVGVDGDGDGGGGGSYQNQRLRGNDVMDMKWPENMNRGMGSGSGNGVTGVGHGYGGAGGLRLELGQHSNKVNDVEEQAVQNSAPAPGIGQLQQPPGVNVGNVGIEGMGKQVGVAGGNVNGTSGSMSGTGSAAVQASNMGAGPGGAGGGPSGGGGGTILFVGDLHWWTTDSELEAELVKYGPVKEVKFFDEKASGKSKGYCQVEFYDPAAATACKEGMNGHVFNGRPCVVAFATPFSIKRMGDAQMNRNQQMTQQGPNQARRGPNDVTNNTTKPAGNNIATGGNYQGAEQNRNFGRGNWGRGNPQGMGNRGPVGPMRNRPGGMAGRGMMGNAGGAFGPGIGPGPLMPPQPMMGQSFDPGFGGPMGRMGNYGGFPGGPTPPFQGLVSSFPPMGNVGLPGVAPHVNPAFFGRGMPMNGMGMMPNAASDGPNMGMWSDPNMGGWAGDEHGGRAGESSYVEEAVSGEAGHDRVGWQNPMKDKDRSSERDFSGTSDRRYRDERDTGYDKDMPREKEHDNEWSEKRHRDDRDAQERERMRSRDREQSRERDRSYDRDRDRDRERERDRGRERYRDDRDRYADHHKYRDREADHDEDWDRGRSSRTRSKSRLSHEEELRSRSRDADYGKRRRITSES